MSTYSSFDGRDFTVHFFGNGVSDFVCAVADHVDQSVFSVFVSFFIDLNSVCPLRPRFAKKKPAANQFAAG